MIGVVCQWCETPFLARKQRVDKGQSKFCSREHQREWLKSIGSQRKNIGKENAIIQWEKSKNMFCAYWYDENMKYKSTSWARWAWELNFGEVPEGYRVSYKDGNSTSNTLDNLFLKHMSEYTEIGDRNRGVPKSQESRKKMSASHSGKTLSDEHRLNIGNAQAKRWAKGDFDNIHKGENNSHWRGGVEKGYPKEFYDIKDFIKERDRYICQICSKSVYRSRHGHVHHMDGNRLHNTDDNLILLCSTCHLKVHSTGHASPVILAFRARLEWNQTTIEEQ